MMDFDLYAEDQRLVRQTVRAFAEDEILPHVERTSARRATRSS